MTLKDETYDILKWIARYLLPAAGTLYFALSSIWGFPYGEQVVGTITAIVTFLGVILGISTSNYSGDGTLLIDTHDPEKDIYRLDFGDNLDELSSKKKVTLLVDANADLR